jgi:hypothetical protein
LVGGCANPAYFLLAIWLWLTLLLGSGLTVDAPFHHTLSAKLALLAIFPALLIDLVRRLVERGAGLARQIATTIAVGTLVTLVAFANVRDNAQVHTACRAPEFTVLSYYMLQVQDQYQVYFISRHDSSLDYDAVNFLVPGNEGISLQGVPIRVQPEPPGKGMMFIIDPGCSSSIPGCPAGSTSWSNSSRCSRQVARSRTIRQTMACCSPARP